MQINPFQRAYTTSNHHSINYFLLENYYCKNCCKYRRQLFKRFKTSSRKITAKSWRTDTSSNLTQTILPSKGRGEKRRHGTFVPDMQISISSTAVAKKGSPQKKRRGLRDRERSIFELIGAMSRISNFFSPY